MQRFFKDKKKLDEKDKKSVEITIPSVLWDISSVENIEIYNHGIKFLTHCTDYLRQTNAITQVGIFRRAGDNDAVASLQQSIWDGIPTDYQFPDAEVDNVATLLKRYFKEMKNPILTHALYKQFIACEAEEDDEKRILELVSCVRQLPPHNVAIMKHLCQFLREVSLQCEVNMMTSLNLAIVFAPNVLRAEHPKPITLISDAGMASSIVRTLIDESHVIFEKVEKNCEAAGQSEVLQADLKRRYTMHRTNSKKALNAYKIEKKLSQGEFEEKLLLIGEKLTGDESGALVTKYFENAKSTIPTSVLTTSTATISEGASSKSESVANPTNNNNHSPKKMTASEKRQERAKEGSEAEGSDYTGSTNTNDSHQEGTPNVLTSSTASGPGRKRRKSEVVPRASTTGREEGRHITRSDSKRMRSRSVKNQLDEFFESVTDATNTNLDASAEGKDVKERDRDLPRSHSLGRDRDDHSHSRPSSLRIEIEEAPKNERDRERKNRRSRFTIENSPSQYASTSPAYGSAGMVLERDKEPERKEPKERTRSPSKSRSSSRSDSTSEDVDSEEPGIVRSHSEAVKNMKRIKGHRKVKSSSASCHDVQNIVRQTM